jgi:putative glutamine amidotransferase
VRSGSKNGRIVSVPLTLPMGGVSAGQERDCMRKPVIGLTTYAEQAKFGPHDTAAAVLPMNYVQAVHAVGGRALLITTDDPDPEILDTLDGIVFTGGSDVDPALYGATAHPATAVRPERDAAEAMLMRAALDADLPLLGVCRGMQLLAVMSGGRLHQHLPDLLGHDRHRASASCAPGVADGHDVLLAPGSLAAAVLGGRAAVNTYHHQAVADPGRLRAVGWCPQDRIIEAVEDPAHRFALGVQWHPERTDDRRTFAALVAAAASRRMAGARTAALAA